MKLEKTVLASFAAAMMSGCATNYVNDDGVYKVAMDCIVGLFEPTACHVGVFDKDGKYQEGQLYIGPGSLAQTIAPAAQVGSAAVVRPTKVTTTTSITDKVVPGNNITVAPSASAGSSSTATSSTVRSPPRRGGDDD